MRRKNKKYSRVYEKAKGHLCQQETRDYYIQTFKILPFTAMILLLVFQGVDKTFWGTRITRS